MDGDVVWGGRWECDGCVATGEEELWDDEDSPTSGHDCEEGGEATWYGQWLCHDCGASGDADWADGSETWSGQACEDQDQSAPEEVAAA